MSEKVERLNPDDVVVFVEEPVLIGNPTFRMSEFMESLDLALDGAPGDPNSYKKFFDEGLACKVLRPQTAWQPGKLRLRLEFVPDEPESPLDEYRPNPPVRMN
jgi:hypothetical protein